MCPLRLILIFLSATLAGFFVFRNLKSKPQTAVSHESDSPLQGSSSSSSKSPSIPLSTKVCSSIGSGFWTFVDMASGKYLWRNLVSSKPSD